MEKTNEKLVIFMGTIKETLHEKRKTTEDHIKQLQQEGKEGARYTAMIPDVPFLVFGLFSDIGWLIHLIAGILYFCRNGFHHVLDGIALIALAAVVFGVAYIIYLNKIHEKEIATGYQKNLGFGVTVYAGRSCDRNPSNRAVCRCFIRTHLARDRRFFKLCFGIAHLSLLSKRDFLRCKITSVEVERQRAEKE